MEQTLNETQTSKQALRDRLSVLGIHYWTLLILLGCIDFLGPLAMDGHLPSLPQMTTSLHTSPAWIQFAVLSYSFVMALSSLCGGILSDAYGRRSVTLCGLCMFVCGCFGCAFSPTILMLNLCRIVQGFGGGISCIITSSVARDVFLANERVKMLAILGGIRPIGIACSPMICGWIGALFGWRAIFLVIATFAAIITTLSWWLLPETKNMFFVNRHKMRLVKTETNVIGNIGIVDDSKLSKHSNKGDIVVLDEDDEDEDDSSNANDEDQGQALRIQGCSSDEEDEDEFDAWSPAIAMRNNMQRSQATASQTVTRDDTPPLSMHDLGSYTSLNPVVMFKSCSNLHAQSSTTTDVDSTFASSWKCVKLWRISCDDPMLMTVSWILALRTVAIFVYLNEFPFVNDAVYHYGQEISGLMIGVGSMCTIVGASLAILCDRDNNNDNRVAGAASGASERSSLLFQLAKKNSKLSMMRVASFASLLCSILLVVPPILSHYDTFLQILHIDGDIHHFRLLKMVYTDNAWFYMAIPFCVLTFSHGLFTPCATVVVLEPYPYIAGSISSILQFWKIFLPTLILVTVTQCLGYHTNDDASTVIHGIVALCSFLCFVLMYCCVRGHDVRLRMCGWQQRMMYSADTATHSACTSSTHRKEEHDGKAVMIPTTALLDPKRQQSLPQQQSDEAGKGVTVMQSTDLSVSMNANMNMNELEAMQSINRRTVNYALHDTTTLRF